MARALAGANAGGGGSGGGGANSKSSTNKRAAGIWAQGRIEVTAVFESEGSFGFDISTNASAGDGHVTLQNAASKGPAASKGLRDGDITKCLTAIAGHQHI